MKKVCHYVGLAFCGAAGALWGSGHFVTGLLVFMCAISCFIIESSYE